MTLFQKTVRTRKSFPNSGELLALYTLDGDLNDATGSEDALVGVSPNTLDRFNVSSRAVLLNGSSQSLIMTPATAGSLDGLNNLGTFVKVDNTVTSDILAEIEATSDHPFTITISGSDVVITNSTLSNKEYFINGLSVSTSNSVTIVGGVDTSFHFSCNFSHVTGAITKITFGDGTGANNNLKVTLDQISLYDKCLTTSTANEVFIYRQEIRETLMPKVTRSTGEFIAASTYTTKIRNQTGKNKDLVEIGDTIEVWIERNTTTFSNKRFLGFCTVLKFDGKGSAEDNITITCKDFFARLQDATVEPNIFRNTETSVIVKEIISSNVQDITTTNVQVTTNIIPSQIYKHTRVDDAISALAKKVNYLVYVDVDKDLHFEPKGAVSSGVVLESGVNILSENFTEKRAGLANKIFVYGARILSRALEFSEVANGTGSVFTLPHKPHNTLVEVAGVRKQGGVFELSNDLPADTNYLIDFDQFNIIFVSGTVAGNNIPTSGDTVTVNYDRQSIISKAGENAESIGSHGPVTEVIFDDSITSTGDAQTRVNLEIAAKSDPLQQGNINVKGIEILEVGQSINVQIPNANIDDDFNILEITYDLQPKALLGETSQTIKLGDKQNELTDTIKNLLKKDHETDAQGLDESDVLSLVRFAQEKVGVEFGFLVKTRDIGSSFILGHAVNGVLGVVGGGGLQPVLGSGTVGPFVIEASGSNFGVIGVDC